jgi:hypothetical protein
MPRALNLGLLPWPLIQHPVYFQHLRSFPLCTIRPFRKASPRPLRKASRVMAEIRYGPQANPKSAEIPIVEVLLIRSLNPGANNR